MGPGKEKLQPINQTLFIFGTLVIKYKQLNRTITMNMASLKRLEIIMGRYGLLVLGAVIRIHSYMQSVRTALHCVCVIQKIVISCTVIHNDWTCYIDLRPQQ